MVPHKQDVISGSCCCWWCLCGSNTNTVMQTSKTRTTIVLARFTGGRLWRVRPETDLFGWGRHIYPFSSGWLIPSDDPDWLRWPLATHQFRPTAALWNTEVTLLVGPLIIFPHEYDTLYFPSRPALRLGTVDAEIKTACAENPKLSKVLPFTARSRSDYSLPCLAYCQDFRHSVFCLPDAFNFIFSLSSSNIVNLDIIRSGWLGSKHQLTIHVTWIENYKLWLDYFCFTQIGSSRLIGWLVLGVDVPATAQCHLRTSGRLVC